MRPLPKSGASPALWHGSGPADLVAPLSGCPNCKSMRVKKMLAVSIPLGSRRKKIIAELREAIAAASSRAADRRCSSSAESREQPPCAQSLERSPGVVRFYIYIGLTITLIAISGPSRLESNAPGRLPGALLTMRPK